MLSRLAPNARILLGLSGGADSSALLHLLLAYSKESGAEIIAAHLNHGIRGEKYTNEAARDEAFCREICAEYGIELIVKHLDIPSLAENSGRSLETEAREARYAFFAEAMRERGIKILATAHNADDNLETQLYNLSRGCGIDGVAGIPSRRSFDAVEGAVVIRPILSAEKREILDFCERCSLRYVTDSTNLSDDCTRNRLRHRVIPALSELFPNIRNSAMRLSCSASEDSDYILSEAKIFLASHGGIIFAKELESLHPALAKRVIMLAFSKISDATLECVHISAILELLSSERNGAALSLPDKKRAEVVDGYLRFCDDTREKQKTENYSQELKLGLNEIENTPFALLLSDCKPQHLEGYALYAYARLYGASLPLYAKNRAPSDTILDGGVNKKIKKLMCDKKVPLADRDMLPLIWSEKSMLYAPMCAICDSAKPKQGDGVIYVAIYRSEEKYE